jgi:hypothetical protein
VTDSTGKKRPAVWNGTVYYNYLYFSQPPAVLPLPTNSYGSIAISAQAKCIATGVNGPGTAIVGGGSAYVSGQPDYLQASSLWKIDATGGVQHIDLSELADENPWSSFFTVSGINQTGRIVGTGLRRTSGSLGQEVRAFTMRP